MFNFSHTQTIGHKAEMLVYDKLEKLEYSPTFCPDFGQEAIDLRVDGLPVEVKFAHKTRRVYKHIGYDRWQWCIHPTSLRLRGEWLLVLIAQTEPGENYFFTLPGSTIGNRSQIQITSHPMLYSGWLAQWLNRWDVIPYLQNGVYRNGGPLFHMMGVT